jgi:hypothetical protein
MVEQKTFLPFTKFEIENAAPLIAVSAHDLSYHRTRRFVEAILFPLATAVKSI